MKVVFWHSEKKHERYIAEAFIEGMRRHGDDGEARPSTSFELAEGFDAHAMVGVKSAAMYHACRSRNIPTLMFDKGYIRCRAMGVSEWWKEWRISVNGQHSTRFVALADCDSRRAKGLTVRPWRMSENIVIAGSSEKYHKFHDLKHPTSYAKWIVKEIRRHSDRPIIYRPKPSWKFATPIPGTTFSSSAQSIYEVLESAHCLVTHGSNACVEAMLYGVPSVILGDGVAAPISSTSLSQIDSPRLATMPERLQWLNNLTYCSWSLKEIDDGKAWPVLRAQI